MSASSRPRQRLIRLVRSAAPELARALGGPLAGAATAALSKAVLGREDGGEEALAEALEHAPPETLLELRRIGVDFRRALLEAASEETRVAAADRASARQREIAVRDRLPGILAILVVAGFFTVLAVMLVTAVPAGAETEFSIMLGALATMAASVMNYYFGSSASSREKTRLLDARITEPLVSAREDR